MSASSNVYVYLRRQAICLAIWLLLRMSDERVLAYARKHLNLNQWPEAQEMFERMLICWKHGLSRCSSSCRRKVATNLIANEIIAGQRKRRSIIEQEGINIPTFFVVSPTMRCNLHCYGCYSAEYARTDDLDPNLLNRVLDEAVELAIYFVVVSGGEPFLYKPLLDIFQRHEDIYFQIYTNGTFIDRKMAQRLAELGNVLPCISVEGFKKETDTRRGSGHFEKVVNAMDSLRDAGVPFGYSATATRENNELICSEEFVDFYADKGCIIGWYFNYVPIGRNPDMSLMPTPEQRDHRRRQIESLRQRKYILLADFWNDGPIAGGCIAGGRRYFHVNNKGDIEPCAFVHFAVDNIHDKSLLEIFRGSPLFRAVQSRQPYGENLLRPCMIIDHPHILREVIRESGARATHAGAEKVLTELSQALDEYARGYARIADKAWETHTESGYL